MEKNAVLPRMISCKIELFFYFLNFLESVMLVM